MAANEIDNFVIAFADPNLTPVIDQTKTRISHNVSYSQHIRGVVRTLSVHDADSSGLINGLLYVPDLDDTDPCRLNPYVPANATQQNNLPNTDFNLIALAPWYNDTCTLSYLKSTTYDPIRAFLFYLPDDSPNLPPPASHPIWNLADDVDWKKNAHFPIYAIPGAIGAQFMTALSEYSGNVTSVPYGRTLIDYGVHPSSYVRVYTEIGIDNAVRQPGLWQFFLVVLGVLALVLFTTSVAMHAIQRARRKELEVKVKRGEIDLEALGVRRLLVDQVTIDNMPLYIYVAHTDANEALRESFETDDSREEDVPCTATDPSTIYRIRHHATSAISAPQQLDDVAQSLRHQPRCIVCLEDYQPSKTIIRELPCGHIYHPDCIDTFLSEVSCLCPVCGKSVFPLGTCPIPITNSMVRRERTVRHLKSKITVFEGEKTKHGVRSKEDSSWSLLGGRQVLQTPSRIKHKPPALPKTALHSYSNRVAAYDDISDSEEEQELFYHDKTHEDGDTEDLARRRRQEMARMRGREFAISSTNRLSPALVGDDRSVWRRSLGRLFPT